MRICGQTRPARALAIGCLLSSPCLPLWAQTSEQQPTVIIRAAPEPADLTDQYSLDGDALNPRRVSSSDTATLLPDADAAQAGGVASLPVIRGVADDRLRVLVNGMPVAAACPMHMNPPLSYMDPSALAHIDTLPGVTPVALGGDNIGGTILVESAPPTFASAESAIYRTGSVSSFYRSNADTIGGSASATVASDRLSLRYDGSAVRAGDYTDGAGERINASRFETSDQQITASYHRAQDLFELQAAQQYMPYEGFPNSDMDLSDNVGAFLNARYQGSFGWGDLKLSAFYDHIRHEMNGNASDRFPPSASITGFGLMPTRERSRDLGYRAQAELALSARDSLRIGNELHEESLDDRWPGTPVGMAFDYVNINDGIRTQLGTFAEWERHWNGAWATLVGVRNDTVWMNAGEVGGYDGADPVAQAFNATARFRTDANVDATLLTRFQPDDQQTYTLGLARKNRSPNLYERYAWGTSTIGMNTWFGDGNGYTGTPTLKPETAYTTSVSANWHGGENRWQIKLTPWYSAVQDYIGVVPICGPSCTGMPASQLLFANHDARLYGVELHEFVVLMRNAAGGELRLSATGGFTRGQDLSTHTDLYHMMPLNGTVGLEYSRGGWWNALQLRAVDRKTAVDEARLEPPTSGFATVDLRAAYQWRVLRLDLGVLNLLNRQYDSPLGGTWQSALYPPGYMGTFRPLPAAARSVDIGLTLRL
jgi:iron complex outermembrane recepter protein